MPKHALEKLTISSESQKTLQSVEKRCHRIYLLIEVNLTVSDVDLAQHSTDVNQNDRIGGHEM